MTQQEVIKSFMNKLANHGYAYSSSVGQNMLDAAVKASSRYSTIQDIINAMEADQIKAEKEAVEEVLGSSYSGKLMSDLSSSILSASAKTYDTANEGNAYFDTYNDRRSTVENLIKERKAYIFLEKYCGIQLEKNYWLTSSGSVTSWTDDTTGNVDTGAITGSDAGGSTEDKTDHSIVPESFINTYTATTSKAQNIITGSRDWVVQATSYDDTITSGGADSINAGDGSDQIIANADGATITSGSGADFITVSENVSDITFSDLDAEDNLTISGEFEIGSAHIEDSLLVVTDSTGTRKIRLADFDTAKNAKINSTTIGDWLSNAGIDFNQLGIRNEELGIDSGANSNTTADSSRIEIDSDYTPSQVEEIISTAPTSTKDTPERCAKTSNDDFVNVNLDNVDTSAADNVSVDGAVVGQLSSTFPNASTFTRNGLTIHLLGVTSDTSGSTDNIQAKTLDELTDDQRTIIAGLFKWWAKECLTLNEESYGISFNSSTTMIKDIGLYFYDSQGSGNTLASVWNTQRKTQDGFATELFLSINMNYYENISSDDMDGTSSKSSAGFLDRTLAHEINHAVMAANINFFGQLPKFIKEGFAELTHGIDDERGNTIFKIAYDANSLDASLDLTDSNTSSQTVGDSYSGGYMFLRYFAKQAANETLPAFGEITATVNLSSDGDYYISGNSTSETASNAAQTIKLGTLSNGIYTVDDSGVHQVINAFSAVKIVGLTSNDIFNGSSGADTVETSEGSNIITGAGNDSVKLYGQYATINTGAGSDTLIIVDGSHHSINLGDGNNLVSISTTYSHSNSIFSGNGSDTIKDSGMSESYIFTGGGNDSIIFGGSDNSIFAGDGNDSVKFQYSNLNNNYINLGAGDDYVTLSGTGNSIIGGAGNDTFYQYNNSAGGNFFIFNSSSGNDLIRGLKSNDTIIITGDYSTTKSGSNIIVTANDRKITLQGVASLSTVNIESKEENPMLITLTEGNDTYSNTVEGATIQALGGDDNLENSGANVLINAGNDNDSVYNGDEGSDVTISGGAGSDTIDNWGLNVSIDGGTGNDVLSNNPDGDGGTILGGAGDDSIYNREMSNRVSINAGDGDDTIENYGANVTISGGAGNDSIYGGDYEGVYIQYASGDGNDSILGFNETSTLQIGGGTYSSQTSGDDIIITVGEGSIVLQNAANLSVVNIDGEEEVANPKWSINGARAIYGTSNETLIAVEGISDDAKASNFYISGNKVTIGKAAVKTDGTEVRLLTNGYTLKLGKGMTAPETLSAAIYDSSTMTLNTKGTTAGYNLSSDKKSISYTSGTSKEFQFSGIADGATASNFYISGKTVTIGKAAVQTNGTAVKLLNQSGYALKFGKGMTASETLSAANYDSSTMTLNTKGTTDGYNLSSDKKSISYTAGTSKEFQFSGIASGTTASNFYISGKTITIGKAAVQTNGTAVKLLNQSGYTLKLGKGMTASKTLSTATYDASTMTYTSKGTTEGYSLSSDKKSISYTAGTSKGFQFSGIAGGATASNFYISGKTITIGKATVQTNGTPIKLLNQSGYTLKLGKGMTAPTDNAPTLKSGVYTFGGKSAGYVLDNTNKTITYSAATSATLELSGVKSAPTPPTDDTLTLKLANFNDNLSVTSNSGKYKFSIASGTYTGKTFTGSSGADTIANAGSSLIINSGKGNDSIKSSGTNSTINAGAGADTVAGSTGADTLNGDAGNDIIWGGKGNDSILGGSGNDSLNGSAGADTLWGGTGNDTLIGGAGNDIFIYKPNEGTDHITDYTSGDILQILNTDGTNGTYTKAAFASNKLTLTISGGGSVIFDNVSAGDKININGTTKTISGNTLK